MHPGADRYSTAALLQQPGKWWAVVVCKVLLLLLLLLALKLPQSLQDDGLEFGFYQHVQACKMYTVYAHVNEM